MEDLARDYAVSDPNLFADPWSSVPEVYFIFGGLLAADALGSLNDYELYSLVTNLESGRGSVAEGIASEASSSALAISGTSRKSGAW